MKEIENDIQKRLFAFQDKEYRDFHAKLIPTINKDTIIGVRSPQIKLLAKEIYKENRYEDFLQSLPHKFYEENNIHGMLIGLQKDYDRALELLDEFLPYVDNWATCDMMKIGSFKKHLTELYIKIPEWLNSDKIYAVRFGIKMLMDYFLGDNFTSESADLVCAVKKDEFYIKMMIAWYFATALAKNYDEVVPYIENNLLEKWTHNKTIQKAIESNRISDEKKAYLRTLKIK